MREDEARKEIPLARLLEQSVPGQTGLRESPGEGWWLPGSCDKGSGTEPSEELLSWDLPIMALLPGTLLGRLAPHESPEGRAPAAL